MKPNKLLSRSTDGVIIDDGPRRKFCLVGRALPFGVTVETRKKVGFKRSIWLFIVSLVLFAIPAASHAQFSYTISDGTITITGYGGVGGAVLIPDTFDGYRVTGIGEDAFYFAENVTSVTIAGSVTNIGEDAFYNSTSITAINIATNNPAYMSLAGVLFNKTQTELVAFPEAYPSNSYEIRDGVISIGADAFGLCANLMSVTIPSSVTSISGGAFADCPRLAGVVIPDGVTSIGGGAFAACGLTNVTISDSVTNLGDGAFSDCRSLTNITLGDSLPSIENTTFQYSGLLNIMIPNSVTNIGNYAFWYSSNLTSVTFGSGVTNLGLQVFTYCPSLAAINVDTNNPGFMSADGILFDKNQSTLIQFPEGNSTASYSIPNSVATIADWSFAGSANLASVTIDTNATHIGNYAFLLCPNLTEVILPKNVSFVGYQAFCGCGALTNAVISNGYIGGEAFDLCSNLTSVTLGNGVTSIGEAAFDQEGLTTLAIPNTLTSIGELAFAGTSLTNLTIPNSVTSIGDGAFSDCAYLANVAIGDGVTNLGEEAFAGCPKLTNVTIGDSVTFIGVEAFSGCPLLTSITIPANVTSIGAAAFLTCTNLTAVYFLGNAPVLDSDVFTNNFGSTEYINDHVTIYYAAGTTGWGTTYGGMPTVELNTIAYSASPSNGAGPLTASFSAASVDGAGISVTNWNWSFGDGSTSPAQNPSHTYSADGTFYPVLFATNSAGRTVLGQRPTAISVMPPRPRIGSLNPSGGSLRFNVSNGLAGGTYSVLESADLTLPLSLWTPIATNIAVTNGDFTISVPLALSQAVPEQFYLIQAH
jgi:hypothetical protein